MSVSVGDKGIKSRIDKGLLDGMSLVQLFSELCKSTEGIYTLYRYRWIVEVSTYV